MWMTTAMLNEGGSVVYIFANIYGKATSPYVTIL